MVAEPGGPRERGRSRMAERIVDVLVPLIMEEIVEMVKVVFQERISERIREQIVDVHVPGAVEQFTEVPKASSRDRTLQCTAEQILDVLVPEMAKQLVEVPETVSQDGVQQRTVEQIVDAPVPQAVEEPAEVSRVFSQDGIQQRVMEQTTPAISLVDKIVEMPDTRKTHQGVNTHVQHVVDTVEVEKHIIQGKINQETKRIEIPPRQFMDKAIDTPVVAQRQVPQVYVVKKTVEDPQFEIVQKTVADKVVDVPVVLVVQAPQVQVSEKTVEISQLQAIEKIVETSETQTIQGARTSERSGTAPGVEEVHATGVVKPDDPDAKIKFFTEEALHGVGGPVFDANGNHVAN